ncbi:MAG TPA: DUF2141 domain-containing protein [Allosphingosinicella sp.]|nr:DUF2141 domain-containing protein [Allosphingosinicella sp.]
MFKVALPLAAAALALVAPAAAWAQAPLGPDAPACTAGNRAAVLVTVDGLKNRSGRLRLQLYGADPEDFLEKGKKLRRIDLPVTGSGPVNVCVALPGPGTYAIAVRHDADANGKSGWSDGGGFSNNPKISLLSLKPSHRQVAFAVGRGVKPMRILLNYRSGLKIGPVGN